MALTRRTWSLALASVIAIGSLAACAAPEEEKKSDLGAKSDKKKDKGSDNDNNNDPGPSGDPQPGTPPADTPPAAPVIYAHTADTLYTFDANSKKLEEVGKLACLTGTNRILDIAVDGAGKVFGTTDNAFIAINPKDATCTIIMAKEANELPNSLSFVPKGTLDAANEALVGYAFDEENKAVKYVRIKTTDGSIEVIGDLNPPSATKKYTSSGDIFSVAKDGNKAFLTVRADPDNNASDMLAEIDPKTGQIKSIVGNTAQRKVYGLAYWADKAYGFSDDGNVREISVTTGSSTVITTLTKDEIPVAWFGAGMTTQAPTN